MGNDSTLVHDQPPAAASFAARTSVEETLLRLFEGVVSQMCQLIDKKTLSATDYRDKWKQVETLRTLACVCLAVYEESWVPFHQRAELISRIGALQQQLDAVDSKDLSRRLRKVLTAIQESMNTGAEIRSLNDLLVNYHLCTKCQTYVETEGMREVVCPICDTTYT